MLPAVQPWPRTEEEALAVQDALRSRVVSAPGPVSVGHRIDLDTACTLTLRLSSRFRLPETTRAADRACRLAVATIPL